MTAEPRKSEATVWAGVLLFLSPLLGIADEPPRPRPEAYARFAGEKAGQQRDDNGLKMNLIWCPPGQFSMTDAELVRGPQGKEWREAPVAVSLSRGFWLGKYEVKQAEWQKVMGTVPWKGRPEVKTGPNFPATYVNWDEGMQFCAKLTAQERAAGRLPKEWEYTLPTAAEWEWACRAGSTATFGFGEDEADLGECAWWEENTAQLGEMFAHEVGRKKANDWGLHDMHGNVWEWCRDAYAKTLPGGSDPAVLTRGHQQVVRGGCWKVDPFNCRCATRFRDAPVNRWSTSGFRVAAGIVRKVPPAPDPNAVPSAPPPP